MLKKRLLLLLLTLCLPATSFVHPQPASAVTASDWKAGRIIDDSIFTNGNDMSVNDIQAFLNSKVPTCDSNGQKSVGYYYNASTGQPKFSWFSGGAWVTTTRAVYAQRYTSYYKTNISNLPFTCLKNYYEVPKTAPGPGLPASNAFGAPIPAGAISAAQMIYNASVKYSINPKVLLVKLHTESAGPLTTDDWPFQNQYLYAMGAHCPDSGPGGSANCDSNYAGFSIQMDEAAALLRWYLNSMTQSWWQYKKPYQTNSILWNVEPTGCGAGNVYIESKATAALYTYTPYQPNQAALDHMYTTGDGCSAYGNRNFWRVYSDWFATTYGDLFHASLISQVPSVSASPGSSSTVTLSYRNTGLWTWHDDSVSWPGIPPLRLATTSLSTRTSIFSYGWANGYSPNVTTKVYEPDGVTLATSSNQHIIKPGQVISFTFQLTIPWSLKSGAYTESFKPILAGSSINLGDNTQANIRIDVPPVFRATSAGQSEWPSLTPGESTDLLIKYRNTGQFAWRDDTSNWPGLPPVYLSTANLNGISIFSNSWPSNSIAAKAFNRVYESDSITPAADQHIVQPGQVAEFKVTVSAPWSANTGKYEEYFRPVLYGSGVNLNAVTGYEISIPAWRSKLASLNPEIAIAKGNSAWVCVRYKNKGAYAWRDKTVDWPSVPPVSLATANANNFSIFSYLWSDPNDPKRIAADVFDSVYGQDGAEIIPNPHVVLSNQTVKFCFIETTPWAATSGSTYVDKIKPILTNSGAIITQPSDYGSVHVFVP